MQLPLLFVARSRVCTLNGQCNILPPSLYVTRSRAGARKVSFSTEISADKDNGATTAGLLVRMFDRQLRPLWFHFFPTSPALRMGYRYLKPGACSSVVVLFGARRFFRGCFVDLHFTEDEANGSMRPSIRAPISSECQHTPLPSVPINIPIARPPSANTRARAAEQEMDEAADREDALRRSRMSCLVHRRAGE